MIKKMLDSGSVTLTMYTPETIFSKLTGHIDDLIYRKIELSPVSRFWFQFQPASLVNFYSTSSISQNYSIWQIVEDLFSFGPTLVTIWTGDDAISKMLSLKGATHPALAVAGTIRERFYCDSPLCNLMHSSDNNEEFLRELNVLKSTDLLYEDIKYMPTLVPDNNIRDSINHSGIISFYNVIVRHLNAMDGGSFEPVRPISDKSSYCDRQYKKILLNMCEEDINPDVQTLIKTFIQGDVKEFDKFNRYLPCNKWEQLIIRSGLFSREKWNSLPSH